MALTKTERIALLESEITEIETALSAIRKGGQSYMIMTSSGSGSQRSVTMADYKMLSDQRDKLRAEVNSLEGTRSVRLSSNW